MTRPAAGWNLADIYHAVAAAVPDRPCQVRGDVVVSWGAFVRRADALAADLVAAGLGQRSKVACYLHNGVEYLEALVGACTAAMVPVNVNFRYGADEIRYLFDNADVEAVVFDVTFAPVLEQIRDRLPGVRRWYAVTDGGDGGDGGEGADVPGWAVRYEDVVARSTVAPEVERSGDDLLLLYTGGTTGIPKGVMWRQDDLVGVLGAGGNPFLGLGPAGSVDEIATRAAAAEAPPVMVVACPLMHGTGQFSALIAMLNGGTVVSLVGRRFDAAELFETVERHRATNIVIVGQAFAGPMLEHLDGAPGRYDLSSVAVISSSGVMWSHDNKQGLLRHLPQAILFDSFGSSEAVGLGASVSAAGAAEETARFAITEDNAVFTDTGRRVAPGSGELGMVAVGGHLPVGYYKDEAKSAATFRVIEGRRWSIPGDFATVNADGTIHLLGRGSVCINTGGEKVFPEEVEEALKTHPAVRDAVVVGVPDERFGEVVVGVVEPADTDAVEAIDTDELRAHVTGRLAPYKAPRRVLVVATIGRAPNGKVDYKRIRADAVAALAAGAP